MANKNEYLENKVKADKEAFARLERAVRGYKTSESRKRSKTKRGGSSGSREIAN